MSPQSENLTPSWKVNLTQKFHHINKKSLNFNNNFELELEQRLNILPYQKSQMSNTKNNQFKVKNQEKQQNFKKTILNQNINNKSNKQTHYKFQSIEKLNKINQLKDRSSSKHLQPFEFDQMQNEINNEEQSIERNEMVRNRNVFSWYQGQFTNKKVEEFLNKNFAQRNGQIQLRQFIDSCCDQYLQDDKLQEFSIEVRQILVNECRQLFCTTQQNLISLNAVELMTKRKQLGCIIVQKLFELRYQLKKQKLQQKYQLILQEILERQQLITREKQQLQTKSKRVQKQQKQLKKKQQQIKSQQKQLSQKEKHLKNILQQKYSKLSQKLTEQYDKLNKQIQKKANAFERNAKNKLQLIEKRSIQQKRAINLVNKDTRTNNQKPQTIHKDSSHKLSNQVYVLKNKLRKTQKQLQSLMGTKSKEIQALQKESNSLLKINTMLQTKLEKQRQKVKELSQILAKTSSELSLVKQEIVKKDKMVTQLKSELLQLQQAITLGQLQMQKGNNIKRQDINSNKINNSHSTCWKSSQMEVKLSQSKRNINDKLIITNEQYQQHLETTQPTHTPAIIINAFNQVFGLILQAFQNHNILADQNTATQRTNNNIKIQELLINQTPSILINCSHILWSALKTTTQQTAIDVTHLIEFMLKLFLAKFSFLQFQSIQNQLALSSQLHQNPTLKCLSQMQEFTQNISTKLLNSDPLMKVEDKIKTVSVFLSYQQQHHQKSFSNKFNLCIILLTLGIDTILDFKTNRLQPIVKKIYQTLVNFQSENQLQKIERKKMFIKLFDQQLVTFMFWKLTSLTTPISHVSIFMDILIQLSNLQKNIQTNLNKQNLLYKTIFALDNYKFLLNFLILNFTDKNLQKNKIQIKQTFQKVSIILQRFCYFYQGRLNISQEDIKRLKKILKQTQKHQDFNHSLFQANLKSILETFTLNEDTQY